MPFESLNNNESPQSYQIIKFHRHQDWNIISKKKERKDRSNASFQIAISTMRYSAIELEQPTDSCNSTILSIDQTCLKINIPLTVAFT